MRLIDADALMHEIEKIKWHLQMLDDTQSSDKVWSGVRMAEKKVEDAPTIDAEPVVRCADCKCWTEWSNGTGSCSRFALDWIGTDADDFCSMGERKDNG